MQGHKELKGEASGSPPIRLVGVSSQPASLLLSYLFRIYPPQVPGYLSHEKHEGPISTKENNHELFTLPRTHGEGAFSGFLEYLRTYVG